MILAIPLSAFNIQFVLFLQPIKNKLIENATFTKIVYSPYNTSLNGVYIYIKDQTMDSILKIEKDILQSYSSFSSAEPSYLMAKGLTRYDNNRVLKISGIWENDKQYGLAYKIIQENRQF
jgi:hypothetical protein